MNYEAIADAGGFGKVTRNKKKDRKANRKSRKPLKSKTKPKSKYKPVPLDVKLTALETKGRFCFAGFCPVCGGTAEVNEHDDPHHFPHRSQGGKDRPKYIWMAKRDCHRFIHDNPMLERLMFQEIEAAGLPVYWKAEEKQEKEVV